MSELIKATFAQMDEAVFEFGETLAREGGVGLFYYAGHGIEAGGVNYLAPVDQDIRAERELRRKAISVSAVLSEMEYARNGTNIIILDACRDNPLPADARSAGSSRGLSVVQAPSGSLVVYATSPGEAAADGRGRNGVFTGALLDHIATPGIDAMNMLLNVRRDVMAATGNEQTPWENSSLTTRFYFAGAPAGGVASSGSTQPTGPRLEVVPTYGEIEISVATAGNLYLDGELIGRLDAGQTARLQDVPIGRRELAMDYREEPGDGPDRRRQLPDGQRERRR